MSTGTIRTYSAVVTEKDGAIQSFGSMAIPVGEVQYTFGGVQPDRRVVLTANSLGLWGTNAGGRYELVAFRIIGKGTLIVSRMFDKPTNPTLDDWTGLGTQKRWDHEQWTCKKGVWMSNTDLGVGLDSATNEAADNGGVPALWSTYIATMATKKCYSIQVYNPSETADVEIETLVILNRSV